MVTTTLVGDAIDAGSRLLKALEDEGLVVNAALWLYFPESGVWRLMMASPVVDVSPRDAYRMAQVVLERSPDIPLTLRDVTFVSPIYPLIEHLKRGVRLGQVVSDMRLFRGAVDGRFIDDAYIYFVR